MMKDFKKDISNSLNEMQENTDKHVEVLKEETQKSTNITGRTVWCSQGM